MDKLIIAVVEDEEVCRDMLVEYLYKYADEENVTFDIHSFVNADKFLASYNKQFSIVFTDEEIIYGEQY